jgi:hypothetical protein
VACVCAAVIFAVRSCLAFVWRRRVLNRLLRRTRLDGGGDGDAFTYAAINWGMVAAG